jgi:hypothetical protein
VVVGGPIEVLAYPVGSGNYAAEVGGTVVVKSSKTPLLAAARYLMAQDSACRDFPLTMVHRGTDYVALSSTVGLAARCTVEEALSGRPVFAAWRH